MSSIWRRFVTAAILLPSLTVIGLHAYLGAHTRLIADDFCSVHFARRLGLLRSIWYWYNNWSGRYTAFGTDWLMTQLGVDALPALPPLVLLVWYLFIVLALHLALRRSFSGARAVWVSLTLGAVFLFVVLLLSPRVQQSLYWWNAMRSYSLPLLLLTAYAVLFQIGLERFKTRNGQMLGSLISFLFLFAAGGLGETYVAFQFGLMAVLVLLAWFLQKHIRTPLFPFLLAGWLGAAAALLAVVFAPGNTVRQDLYPPHPGLLPLAQMTLGNYLDFLVDILQTPPKATGLLGALLTAFWIGTQSEPPAEESPLRAPIAFLGALLLSIACLVPGVYATSEPSAPRTMIIPVFILVAGWQYAGFTLGQQFTGRRGFSGVAGSVIPALAVFLVGYAALVNGWSLYNSRAQYIDFTRRWQVADSMIVQARERGEESVTIPAVDAWIGPGGANPTGNPRHWINTCYSLYYDISVLGPGPSSQQH